VPAATLIPAYLNWPTRRERILALASRLSHEIDLIDLDEIDGEFFWRICGDAYGDPRWQLAISMPPQALETLLQSHRRADGPVHKVTSAAEFAADLLEDLWDQLTEQDRDHSYVQALLEVVSKAEEGLPPSFSVGIPRRAPDHVWDHLFSGARIGLHPPPEIGGDPRGDRVQIFVYSQKARGEDLEEIMSRLRELSGDSETRWASLQISLNVDFRLRRKPHLLRKSSAGPVALPSGGPFPNIIITLHRPLPPKGVLGREYDALVRNEWKWHEDLPGGGTKQDKEVAIRTWAIGLLMKEGLSFSAALRALESPDEPIDLSQEADRQARNRLIERVPDAERYLVTRRS
jgi:hypothetical protein